MIFEMLFGKECQHKNVNIEDDFAYCPDCGEYIENRWYMTRCKCCNIKRKATIRNGKVQPLTKYCPNCGAIEYEVELIPKINFIDINFAVLQKTVISKKEVNTYKQIWEEEVYSLTQKLLCSNV